MIIPDHYIFTADARANRNVDILRCVSPTLSFIKIAMPCRNQKLPSASLYSCLHCSLAALIWQIHNVLKGAAALAETAAMACRDVVKKYGIKYFYDITDRSDFRANPDYKGVCHVALAQEGHCKPGEMPAL